MPSNPLITDPRLRQTLAQLLNVERRHHSTTDTGRAWDAGRLAGMRAAMVKVQMLENLDRAQRELAEALERERRRTMRRIKEINRGLNHLELIGSRR